MKARLNLYFNYVAVAAIVLLPPDGCKAGDIAII